MKRRTLKKKADYQRLVIGIASDMPIWKLCWQINKNLHLSLKRGINHQKHSLSLPPEVPLLFEKEALEPATSIYYEDITSSPLFEVEMHEMPFTKALKEIRSFRYILLLRFVDHKRSEAEAMGKALNQLSFVVSAVDLTHVKNIKQLFL